MDLDQFIEGHKEIKVHALKVEDWEATSPGLLFMKGKYGNSIFLKNIRMFRKEVDQTISVEDLLVLVSGINYDEGQVTKADALAMVRRLEQKGVI